jgi:ABC-2 type transport system ATP-binding protein
MIDANHLHKRYGRINAVKDVSFQAQTGQITGFLGANGAGKTTTMRMLAGYLPPTAGTATVAGYDVFDQSMQVRQSVGYLPESVPLYRDMTVRDYLLYLAEIRRTPQRHTRADVVLEQVGMTERAQSRIRTLSKGMRQRVGLASVLIHEPPVLILDEPTIGLDPLQVQTLRQQIRDLRHEHTVLFSTHILSEAEQVCDNIVILHEGEVLAQGTPAELRAQWQKGGRLLVRVPADAFTSAGEFLRSLPEVAHVSQNHDALMLTPKAHLTTDDLAQNVAQALTQANIPLHEIRPLALTLEEVFLSVVGNR